MKAIGISDSFFAALACALLLLSVGACLPDKKSAIEKSDPTAEADYDANLEQLIAIFKLIDEHNIVENTIKWDRVVEIAKKDRLAFVSAFLNEIRIADENELARLEGMANAVGFESLEDFERAGNAAFQAIAVLTFQKGEKKTYKEIVSASEVGRRVWLNDSEYGDIARLIYAVPKTFVASVEPHYDYLVVDRGVLSSGESEELAAYYSYLALLPSVNSLFLSVDVEFLEAVETASHPAKPISSMVEFLPEYYPFVFEFIEDQISQVGFANIDEWADAGDRLHIGMIVTGFEQQTSGAKEKIISQSAKTLSDTNTAKSEYNELILSFSDVEWAFFEENYDRFQAILAARE